MARILVAEDDELVANVVLAMLRSGGYEVVLAKNGTEAVRIFGEQQFDLVLCDVHMPGKDGLEVTEEIRRAAPDMLPGGLLGPQLLDRVRAHLPGLRALFTSGYSEATLLPRQRLDGEIPLLQKPYSRQDLAFKIRSALDAARP